MRLKIFGIIAILGAAIAGFHNLDLFPIMYEGSSSFESLQSPPTNKLRHQEITIYDNFKLASFDAVDERSSAVLTLRNSEGRIMWVMKPTDYGGQTVKSITFGRRFSVPFLAIRLRAKFAYHNGQVQLRIPVKSGHRSGMTGHPWKGRRWVLFILVLKAGIDQRSVIFPPYILS